MLVELSQASITLLGYFFYGLQVVEESLAKVKLTESAKVRSRSYSGGMRRRLSVAIALLGDPKLIILDEPVRRLKAFIYLFDLFIRIFFTNLFIFLMSYRPLVWIQYQEGMCGT